LSNETLWTVSDVAHFLNVTPKTVYRLVQNGEIPSFKMGWVWRFREQEVRQWLEQQRAAEPPKKRPASKQRRGKKS
jgi:excisionase family DNA binding protein